MIVNKQAVRTDPRGAERRNPKLLELCAVDYTAYYLLRPLARALRSDYEVHFASAPGALVKEIEDEGFPYHAVPLKRNYNLFAHVRAVFILRGLMKREKFAIVHTHTPIASVIGRIAAKLAGVPVVLYTAHGFYFHERMRAPARRLFVTLEKIGGRFTDFVFTQSAEDCDSAVRFGIVDSERVLHIGNGVDLARFDPARLRGERDRIRERLGIGREALVVSIVGRLVREKGYLELVEAFSQVVGRFPNAVLVGVGNALQGAHDDASVELGRSLRRLRLEESVRLLTPETPVDEVLAASDLYVLPSHREGMPRSILEAMAMGLPVVATRIRGSREIVVDGQTGTLVEVGDINGLAGAIVDLLAQPQMRIAFGERAQAIARKEFDESRVIATQRAVIARLCVAKGVTAR